MFGIVLGSLFMGFALYHIVMIIIGKNVYRKNKSWLVYLIFFNVAWLIVDKLSDGDGFSFELIGLVSYFVTGVTLVIKEQFFKTDDDNIASKDIDGL